MADLHRSEHIEPDTGKAAQLKACMVSACTNAAAVVVVLAILGGIGYGVYDAIHVPEYSCQAALENDVEVRVGRKIIISKSSENEICTLEGSTVLGRSYGGYPWEAGPVYNDAFSCDDNGKCSVFVPADQGPFRLTSHSNSARNKTSSEVARFLMQATFGPTQGELDSWGSKTFKQWITDQMDLPPSLHRAYLRKRSSPRTRSHSLTGRPRKACENLSRWHRHAFNGFDIENTVVITPLGNGNATLDVNGVPRVEVPIADWSVSGSLTIKICTVEEFVGGRITFGSTDCSLTASNPGLYFAVAPSSRMISFGPASARLVEMAAPVDGVRVLVLDSGTRLDPCIFPGPGPIFLTNPSDGQLYQHDGRLVLMDNTIESPAEVGTFGGLYSVSAPKTFMNKDSCVVGGRNSAPRKYASKTLTLDDATLRSFYTEGGQYVYKVDGLTTDFQRNPCDYRISRWLKVSCESGDDNDKLTSRTVDSFESTFATNTDTNPVVKTLFMASYLPCDRDSVLGATLNITGTCWRNVHPHYYNVYDFTRNADKNTHLRKHYVIRRPAEVHGLSTLTFPASHPASHWNWGYTANHLIGRYMDQVDFSDLPPIAQTREMADFFGVSEVPNPQDDFTERCGSPGEVANDPSLGARFPMSMYFYLQRDGRDLELVDLRVHEPNRNKAPFAMLATSAADQLRQRMAFALSGILVVTEVQVPVSNREHFLAYYDIFVRHAFGNYRDVLKEVSYHPLMATMLTYEETKSFEYSLRQTGSDVFPDENYAREIMQLFTIGLHHMNSDGTKQTDSDGLPIETYTNEDIMAFSRAWTGFKRQASRGNIEGARFTNSINHLDPMQIVPEYRDQFPKMDLYRGHIGDGYPLCVDFPEKMFLRKGATWTYLGTDPMTTQDKDPDHLEGRFTHVKRVTLDPASALYEALCQPDGTGKCNYKSTVELDEHLACHGIECEVDALRAVNISNAYYEFVRPPCIRFPFFNNGKKIQRADGKDAMCAHPKEIVAAEACCDNGTTTATQNCLFAGERLSFPLAQERCANEGKHLCDFSSDVAGSCFAYGPHWTTGTCDVLVKISSVQGKVAIVHEPEAGPRGSFTKDNMRPSVKEDSRNWFRVAWKDNSFPSSQNGCKDICEETEANECICRVTVSELPVFDEMPSKLEVLEALHIGSLNPEVFDSGEYTLSVDEDDVKAYVRTGGTLFDKRTIFKVTDRGEDRFLVNMESTVSLSNGDAFRNPANLMGIVKPTARDAQYETDAVIDHFFRHKNTAPFVAYRIIQRLVTSNPSRRYLEVCADAFTTGSYEGIGSGKYGDLAALVAAVLLDREARESILDSDSQHGQLREPLLKLIHMFRSLELTTRGNREIDLMGLNAKFAQNVLHAPGVFSYFKPEYAPLGSIANSGLVAPEAEIFTAPNIVNFVNGMFSLVRLGLSNCYDGFGMHFDNHDCYQMASGVERPEQSPAMLGWIPRASTAEGVVDELDLLLTAGRLEDYSRDYIVNEFKVEAQNVGFDGAVTLAKQLLISAPEFHVTNHVRRKLANERPDGEARNGTKPFKAIVFLLLVGGMDSYNLIVPHSDCKNGKDMYQEYADVRTDIALNKATLLPFDVPPGEQVCNRFGLHPAMPKLHELYNQGEALFMANVGPLVEPVTKEEVMGFTKRLPQFLYAHNVQQEATQTMFPQRRVATGVLGHMNDALYAQGYNPISFSASTTNQVLQGDPGAGPEQIFVSRHGSKGFDPFRSTTQILDGINSLNEIPAESMFAENWASSVANTFKDTEKIGDVLSNVELEQPWASTTPLGLQLEVVSKLIKGRGLLGTDRQTFFTALGGFDTHSSATSVVNQLCGYINEAITSFEAEMKLQGVWDDVLLVEVSDFGRTITSNGAGTDHGWGGNYFMLGGSLQGGTMLGEYPDDLTANGPTNLGRGRILPTTSWDEIWNGIALWFGVEQRRMDLVLPNKGNFADKLIGQKQLFGTEDSQDPGSEPAGLSTELIVGAAVAVGGVSVLVLSVIAVTRSSPKSPEPSLLAKISSNRLHKSASNPRHDKTKHELTAAVFNTKGEAAI